MNRLIVLIAVSVGCLWFTEVTADGSCDTSNAWKKFVEGASYITCSLSNGGTRSPFRGFRFNMKSYNITLISASDALDKEFISRRKANTKEQRVQEEPYILSDHFDFTAEEIFDTLPGKNGGVVASIGYPEVPGNPVARGFLKLKKIKSRLATDDASIRYMTGVLCFNREENKDLGREVSAPILYAIYPPDERAPSGSFISLWEEKRKCDSGIQVGPRIVEKEKGKKASFRGIYRRGKTEPHLILWMGEDYKVYLGFWSKIDLYAIQELLLKGKLGEGSVPLWAVNISIRDLAGFHSKKLSAGNTNATNAAYLIFSPIDR